MIGQSMYLAVK